MTGSKEEHLVLPALRGVMGVWVYYSCLTPMVELAKRVQFADEIHASKGLSDMIQRQLKLTRAGQIASYLKSQPERFFNSLVVATYGGQPSWHAISTVKTKPGGEGIELLPQEVLESVGFLSFRGDEKLFALDGQHRLAGIKRICSEGLPRGWADEVSVIFVAHKSTQEGLERTRRLFTTLNKTAKPVSKGDIIALDEDDAMAICTRRLIEETKFFSGEKIAFVASNNMPSTNSASMTTIGNLYDVLTVIYTQASTPLKSKRADLQRVRLPDERLDQFFELAVEFFELIGGAFSEVGQFFSAANSEAVVTSNRGPHGGSVLFRPIGLDIYAKLIARLSAATALSGAVSLISKLPRSLDKAPYRGLLWDPHTRTMSNAHTIVVREALAYMVGASKWSDGQLLERYRKALGNENAELPKPVI